MTILEMKKLYIMLCFTFHGIQEPKTSLAIVILETGHLQCNNCSLDNNNLFGFLWKKEFKKFKSYNHCIKYYKKWQVKHWYKYHNKYPSKSYHEFLKHIYFCNDMANYNKNIKQIEKQLKL